METREDRRDYFVVSPSRAFRFEDPLFKEVNLDDAIPWVQDPVLEDTELAIELPLGNAISGFVLTAWRQDLYHKIWGPIKRSPEITSASRSFRMNTRSGITASRSLRIRPGVAMIFPTGLDFRNVDKVSKRIPKVSWCVMPGALDAKSSPSISS